MLSATEENVVSKLNVLEVNYIQTFPPKISASPCQLNPPMLRTHTSFVDHPGYGILSSLNKTFLSLHSLSTASHFLLVFSRLQQAFTVTMETPCASSHDSLTNRFAMPFKRPIMCTLHWTFKRAYLLPEVLNYSVYHLLFYLPAAEANVYFKQGYIKSPLWIFRWAKQASLIIYYYLQETVTHYTIWKTIYSCCLFAVREQESVIHELLFTGRRR